MGPILAIRRTTLYWTSGLLLLGLVAPLVLRLVAGMQAPAGSDPHLWVLSAMNIRVGAAPVVPPAYPALIAALHAVFGGRAADVAQVVSWTAGALVFPATWLLARRLGASERTAGIGAAILLTVPTLAAFSVQLQPDALVTLLIVLVVGVSAQVLGASTWPAHAALVALAAIVPMMREHGLVLLPILVSVALLAPGRWRDRLLWALGVAVAACLGPVLVGEAPSLPWEGPWYERLSLLSGSGGANAKLPEELPQSMVTAFYNGDTTTYRALTVGYNMIRAPGLWLWVLVGLGAALLCRRELGRAALAPIAGLLPALATLVVWSERRHVAVTIPIAAAAWAAAAGHTHGRKRLIVLLSGALGVLLCQPDWPDRAHRLRKESTIIAGFRSFGERFCEVVSPGDLGFGEYRMYLYCPLPRATPTGAGTAADWRTWWISPAGMLVGWHRVNLDAGRYSVFRLVPPPGWETRPCSESVPDPASPYISFKPLEVVMTPECFVPPPGPARSGLEMQ